jgi:HD-GYP domain-containing protein (c-di-GMP phosphodiesterase class II)
LRGEEIPVTARIFAVVDALDAMVHDRPYRRAMPLDQALQVVRDESAKQFDPRVVDAALAIPAVDWAPLLQASVGGEAAALGPAAARRPSE